MRLALRAVRVALRHLEYATTMQRLDPKMVGRRLALRANALGLERDLELAACASDAHDAAWRLARGRGKR